MAGNGAPSPDGSASTGASTRVLDRVHCPDPLPDGVLAFQLIERRPCGRNSSWMRFALPSVLTAETESSSAKAEHPDQTLTSLGDRGLKLFVVGEPDPKKQKKEENGDSTLAESAAVVPSTTILEKSYSPVQLPSVQGYFDLLIKGYEYRAGGGLGAFLHEHVNVGETACFKVKPKPRSIHGVTVAEKIGEKWPRIGLVAGGTGLAPLIQIARAVLSCATVSSSVEEVCLLFINREEQDILMREDIEALAAEHPAKFRVTYGLTGADPGANQNQAKDSSTSSTVFRNIAGTRGDAALAREALPRPSEETLVLVCGADGFVEHWAGKIVKETDAVTGKKAKVQGPLCGVLKDAGFVESMVYKY